MFTDFGVVNYWTYLIAVMGAILIPGPNSLFVLATAAQRGVAKGYQAACGVFLGDAILMTLSVLGVASLLKTWPLLFLIVKGLGATYLVYLGFMMLKGAWSKYYSENSAVAAGVTTKAKVVNPFRKALLLSLSNPKSILFFVAFFIQFVDPTYAHTGLSFLILALTVQLCSFTYLTFLIFAGASLAAWFYKKQHLAAMAMASVGLLFIGFGIKLAIASLD